MATYEQVVRETDRFTAMDTQGNAWTVVEMTTSKVRVGFIAKPRAPIKVATAYALADGTPLLQRGGDQFQTQDRRLLLVRATNG